MGAGVLRQCLERGRGVPAHVGCTPTLMPTCVAAITLKWLRFLGLGGGGAGFKAKRSGCRVQGAGCRVQGAGFRVQGSGCRVQGAALGAVCV